MTPAPSVPWQEVERKTTEVLGSIVFTLPFIQSLGLQQIVDKHCPYDGALSHGQVFVIIVLNRLHSPHPLYKVGEWAAEVGLTRLLHIDPAALHDDRLADTLVAVYRHQEAIQTDLTLVAVERYGLKLDEIHYDLTSVFFRGLYEASELLRNGHSRDNKPEEVQVILGVSVSADGDVPIRSQAHPGNTADVTTQVANFHALARMLGTSDFLLTSDRIMQSAANMLAIERAGGRFLGPISLEGSLARAVARLPEWLFQRLPYTDSQAHQNKKEPAVYRGAYIRPSLAVKEALTPEEKATERARRGPGRRRTKKVTRVRPHGVVVWDSQRQAQEGRERERAIQRYEEALQLAAGRLNQRRYKGQAYVQERLTALTKAHQEAAAFVKVQLQGEDSRLTLQVERDQAAIDATARLDGKWLLVSNEPLGERSKVAYMDWALERYKKGHRRVEGRMRNLKSDIPIRPLYLHNDERIGGLCFAHIVALMVFSLLERECGRKLAEEKLTFKRLVAIWAVCSLTVFHLKSGEQVCWPDDFTPRQEYLLSALGLLTPAQKILARGLSP